MYVVTQKIWIAKARRELCSVGEARAQPPTTTTTTTTITDYKIRRTQYSRLLYEPNFTLLMINKRLEYKSLLRFQYKFGA